MLLSKQRVACMHALKTLEDKLQDKMKYNYNICLCSKHFYPSILLMHPNKGIILQVGACPTLYLPTFSLNNKQCTKNKVLLRAVAFATLNQ